MAYTQEEVRTPTSIGDINLELYDLDGVPANMTGNIRVTVLDQNGVGMRHIRASLNQEASAAVKTAFVSAITAARVQAEAELI